MHLQSFLSAGRLVVVVLFVHVNCVLFAVLTSQLQKTQRPTIIKEKIDKI